MKATTAPRPTAPDRRATSLQIPELDGNALKKLSSEPNSSKFAIDAHNRAVQEIKDLSELPKLCSLDVSFNRLQSLKNIHTAKELRELKAYNNKLTTLRGVRGNGNLEGLLAHENQLEEISEDLLALVKLKTLWLNGNRLAKVEHLTACRLLVHLDLSRNRLASVAAEGLDSLSSLEYLNLSGNQLAAIGNLTHLTKLEELNLANNRLATLEGGLLPPNISVLRLNDNQLASLHSFPPYLLKLNELYLQHNAITDLLGNNASLAAKFPALESLDLRGNRIRSIQQLLLSNALVSCSATLMDLWIQGNPCCVSETYLLDVISALPQLRTLDNMSDTQLKSHSEALQNGTITQEALLAAMARPMTPSLTMAGGRPGSASLASRPGSSGLLQPGSASSRPVTPDRNGGVPVFHQPSARAGSLLKVASPDELERAHADVADRLEKMKAMLRRVGKDNENVAAHKKELPVLERSRSQRAAPDQTARERVPFRANGSNAVAATETRAGNKGNNQEQTEEPRKSVKPKRGVDAGTDPLDSLMGAKSVPARVAVQTMTPETTTPRRGMETQTPQEAAVSLPPAPLSTTRSLSTVSLGSTLSDVSAMTDNQNGDGNGGLPEEKVASLDGEAIERDMKKILLQYVASSDMSHHDDAKLLTEEPQNDDLTESPRIESNKTAETRMPPNPRSRQGYRSFRVPARLRDAASDAGALSAANAV